MATIEIRSIPHRYDLSAPRPGRDPIIFLHGWLLSRHYWQPVIEQLSTDYQCLSYDLRGFGDSQGKSTGPLAIAPRERHSQRRQQEAYSPRAYAEDIGELMDQLGIEKAWLVGHSLGGTIALWGGHSLGDRIAGMVCLNSGGGLYLEKEFRTFRKVGQQLVKWRPRWLKHFPVLHWMFCYDSVPHPLLVRWGRQRVLDFMAANGEAALGSLLTSTTRAEVHRLPQLVAELPQPAYFIAGQEDTIMEPRYVQHLASYHALYGAKGDNLIKLPGCGHMAMVEQPSAVVRHLCQIFDRHPRDCPPVPSAIASKV